MSVIASHLQARNGKIKRSRSDSTAIRFRRSPESVPRSLEISSGSVSPWMSWFLCQYTNWSTYLDWPSATLPRCVQPAH